MYPEKTFSAILTAFSKSPATVLMTPPMASPMLLTAWPTARPKSSRKPMASSPVVVRLQRSIVASAAAFLIWTRTSAHYGLSRVACIGESRKSRGRFKAHPPSLPRASAPGSERWDQIIRANNIKVGIGGFTISMAPPWYSDSLKPTSWWRVAAKTHRCLTTFLPTVGLLARQAATASWDIGVQNCPPVVEALMAGSAACGAADRDGGVGIGDGGE